MSNIKIGDHVTLGEVPEEPRLTGASGVVIKRSHSGAFWMMKLDGTRKGFISGTAYFRAHEVAVLTPANTEEIE